MKFDFCCPTLFGLEGIVGDELRFGGGLENVQVENGRVFFSGDESTLVWANLWLRCAERVLIKIGEFPAPTFDALFEGTKALLWENYIPANGAFPVKGHSLNSKLFSIPDCQSIVKKAVVSRLSEKYKTTWFEELGEKYQIQFAIMNDVATLYLDTSGAGLHKRGYRAIANEAPLRETLAAAMVKLARYRGREEFLDPFCGSGTIAIEAALIAMNRAPGFMRTFDSEKWGFISKDTWKNAREDAISKIRNEAFPIFAGDIDKSNIDLSIANARKAGVLSTVRFDLQDATKLNLTERTGTLICNPPYGERLLDLKTAEKLYSDFGKVAGKSPMKQYIISSDQDFETFYGYKADKKRKLYNGMIKCDLYMYFKDPKDRKKVVVNSDSNKVKPKSFDKNKFYNSKNEEKKRNFK